METSSSEMARVVNDGAIAISGGGVQVSSDTALSVARTKSDAVLAKPFENADLMATVDRLLAKK